MASAMSVLVLFMFLVVLQGSMANVYTVGDKAGWTIIGTPDYEKWASSKSIHVGDTIVFHYRPEYHNVIQVNPHDYASCNVTKPLATYTTGNDTIAFLKEGQYYFLCGTPGHCKIGMKVEIEVLPRSEGHAPAASPPSPLGSMAPAPSSHPPTASPSSPIGSTPPPSTPVTRAAVHKVGGKAGWTIIGTPDYKKWASSNTFHVGNTIVFQYRREYHNVIQVNLRDYASCKVTTALATYTTGNDSISLNKEGHHYFLCSTPGHCKTGMKVDIEVLPPSKGHPAAGSPSSPLGSMAPAHSPHSKAASPSSSMAPAPLPHTPATSPFSA